MKVYVYMIRGKNIEGCICLSRIFVMGLKVEYVIKKIINVVL